VLRSCEALDRGTEAVLTAILTAMSAVIFANDVPSASRSAHPIVSTETTLFLPSPAVWDAATFESGDPLLNAVWDKGILYLESARASGFDDVFFGETPEAFGVDARIARAYAWYTGDICPLEAALYRFYLTGVDAYSNGYFLWPETLLRYLDFGGDTVKARLWARHALPEMAARLERFTGETGLLGADVLEEADAAMDVPSLNAFYYHFLDTAANAARRLDLPAERYASSARDVRAAFRDTFWDDDCQCVLVPDDSLDGGILANALAVLFGFVALDEDDAIIQYIRTEGAAVDAAYQPYIVEACFRAGEYRLGYDMLTFFTDPRATVSVVHLIPEYVAGLEQRGATVRVAPRFGPQTAFARLHTPVVGGRASVHYDRDHGVRVLLPPDTEAGVRATLGEPVVVKNVVSHGESELTPEQIARLEAKGWSERVGDERAIWVSVGEQRLRCIQNGRILYEARSAAAEKGIG